MSEAKNDPLPSDNMGQVKHVSIPPSPPQTGMRSQVVGRPVGDIILAAALLLAGLGFLIMALGTVFNLLVNPRGFVHTFIWAAAFLLVLVLLAAAVLFIQSARAIWNNRRWGLYLAAISFSLPGLWGVLILIGGSLPGLVLVAIAIPVWLYILQPHTRARFR
jgi:hypothetical protein